MLVWSCGLQITLSMFFFFLVQILKKWRDNIWELIPVVTCCTFSLSLLRDNDITGVLDHTFCVEHNAYGEIIQHELKPNGKSIPVTEDTKKEYVRYGEGWACEYRKTTWSTLSHIFTVFMLIFSLIALKSVSCCILLKVECLICWQMTFSYLVSYRPSSLFSSVGCMWIGVSCMASRPSFWPCKKASMRLSLSTSSKPLTRRSWRYSRELLQNKSHYFTVDKI